MRRNYPFLLMGLAIASGVSSGCGGDEFGTVDPGSQNDRDGAADGKSPGIDGSSSGGGGGVGGTGGAGGSGASGGSSGAGGGGGTGGSAGKDGGSDGGGKGGADAAADVILFDVSDGPTGDGLRADADAGRAGDVLDAQVIDGPTGSDGPGDSAADSARDSSVSPDATGSDVACSEPITYYKDLDGDGFGVSTASTITCTPPGNNWSVLPGDCRDDLPNVKPYSVNSPDPPRYSGTGYTDMAKPQGVSFDYDCTDTEDFDPNNAEANAPEPDCAGLLNCTGAGYMAVNPARTGNGINPRCGSTTIKRCNGSILNCNYTLEVTTEPYRCR